MFDTCSSAGLRQACTNSAVTFSTTRTHPSDASSNLSRRRRLLFWRTNVAALIFFVLAGIVGGDVGTTVGDDEGFVEGAT